MRVMAIDYGDVRTGVAVSDASCTLVGEAWVVQETILSTLTKNILLAATTHGVDIIVVGYPKNMNGSVGPRAEKSERLATLLRNQGSMDVVLWDERMTTMSANRILSETGKRGKKRKDTIDAVAASLILESYLRFLSSSAQNEES